MDGGGYRESVSPGRTGGRVPATAESIVAAIQEGTPDRVAGMRPACEERAKAFDAQRFVERMRDLVGRLDAGAEAAPAKY